MLDSVRCGSGSMSDEEKYTETLYVKRGDQYIAWGNTDSPLSSDRQAMKAGTFRLIHCSGDGGYRIRTDVTPDTAAFIAAATIAQDAMEKALLEASRLEPRVSGTLTAKQRKILDRFQDQMSKAGGLVPHYWHVASANEIATAGINAVLEQLLLGGAGE